MSDPRPDPSAQRDVPVTPVATDDRRNKSIVPLIIGALLALALLWALMNYLNRNRAVDVDATNAGTAATATTAGTPADAAMTDARGAVPPGDPAATNDWLPIAAIFGGPETYIDKPASGNAKVVDVPTDRGFWIEQNGQRMFVMVNEPQSMEQALDINAGQTLRLSGTVHDNTSIGRSGVSLTEEAKKVIGDQRAFLLVQPADIAIVSQ